MHGSAPKLLIIAKKEVIGDDGHNFDGDTYLEAKKKMMEAEEPDSEHMEEMRHISEKLQECAKRLVEMTGVEPDAEDEQEEGSDKGSYGEAKELE